MSFRKGAYIFLDKTFLEYIPKDNISIPMDKFRSQPLGAVCIQACLGNDEWRMHARISMDDLPYPYGGRAGWVHIKDVDNFDELNVPPEIQAQMLLIG